MLNDESSATGDGAHLVIRFTRFDRNPASEEINKLTSNDTEPGSVYLTL